ncbi:glycosyltransferase family 4 protein, partial [bacterium]|nr:glycosyltransferase family 4 protein [bacterium]
VSRSDIRPFKNNVVNRWFCAQQVDQVILSGRFHLEQGMMAPFALPDECITVVPLGMEMPPLEPLTERPRPFRLVMVARFDRVKGHLILLDAFRRVQPAIPEVELGLIGYPAAISSAELRRAAAGLPVHIIDGPVDMQETLAGYQVGIIASTASEAVARSGLEYLNRGMPVIGTRVNSIPELVDEGVNGLLVPPDDPGALGEAMVRIYHEYTAFQAGVMRTRERYSLERMITATATIYGQLL